ncbi:MerR family transcriptional regulator [Oceanobacillus profundus]|uniref:MerR family transcriptional regulator n=1 Tax=Oceanobacillus profundus TaxID=372463 RepID=A0A417YDY9_9BACI|nr:MerR family transcriptional regulator [Oceanobacillus profundus]MDO6448526.1 MerR family transcriptional regulator [Oceanobacillus profundus]RHW30867.1 MerR family transcriptional regulator [Oceanobacillus profundus]
MATENFQHSYSLTEIAKQLGRPRTTVQEWRNQFKPYLPTVQGTQGRTTRYEASALALFQLIAHLKEANEPISIIEQALIENSATTSDNTTANIPSFQPQVYEGLKQLAVALDEQRQLNKAIMKELQELRQQQTTYYHELMELLDRQNNVEENIRTRDFRLLETMRDMQDKKKKEKQRGGFFSIVFNR